MDRKEQRHEHHRHEREQRKKEEREHERRQEKSSLPFHPAWLVAAGVALTVVAVLVWTFIL
jgi:Ca2+/H+ antiporter